MELRLAGESETGMRLLDGRRPSTGEKACGRLDKRRAGDTHARGQKAAAAAAATSSKSESGHRGSRESGRDTNENDLLTLPRNAGWPLMATVSGGDRCSPRPD